MKRALISGVTGGVGQAMAHQLLAAGVEVHGLSRQERPTLSDLQGSTLSRQNGPTLSETRLSTLSQQPGPTPSHPQRAALQPSLDDMHWHRVDGTTESTIALMRDIQPDTIFHLAALARREHLSTDVTPFINANILFGTQLLEAARATDCRRFISAGSYLQHAEDGEHHSFNLYSATKTAFEDILTFYADAYSFATVVVTVCNAYSEYDKRPTLLSDMAVAVTQEKPLHLHAEEAWVDLVHVEDVAGAFIQAASLFDQGAVRAGARSHFAATSGKVTSSTELVAVFERLGGQKLTIQRGSQRNPARRGKPWRGEPVPGWTPHITLDEGVKRFLERARQGAWGTS